METDEDLFARDDDSREASYARQAGTPLPAAGERSRPLAVTQAEAEAAVRVLIQWAGDDPEREGLLDTPARVARSYRELFAG